MEHKTQFSSILYRPLDCGNTHEAISNYNHACINQNGSYRNNFFHIMRDSDVHFIIQGVLKMMTPTP